MMVVKAIVALGAACLAVASWSQSVLFINPGLASEAFWWTSTQAMQAAANDLGMRLETVYLERKHQRLIDEATRVAALPKAQRPDYVIMVNEGGAGLEALRILNGVGQRVLFAYSAFSQVAERQKAGRPRGMYPMWLASLEPVAEEAGYLTAKALIEAGRQRGLRAPDGKLHVLAFSGDRTTPTSIKRGIGMRHAVAEATDVVVDQEVFAGFNADKAREKAAWLYRRHPKARLVWAGNDLMAFGAMQEWERLGGVPGRDMLFSGVNTSEQAVAAVRSGRLSALAGGHFILGAWAMVMLHDHHHGKDFANDEGVELNVSMFTLFSSKDAERFNQRYAAGQFDGIDFRRFSKVYQPQLRRYDFSFRQLLQDNAVRSQ